MTLSIEDLRVESFSTVHLRMSANPSHTTCGSRDPEATSPEYCTPGDDDD